jgi:hypothetical protein
MSFRVYNVLAGRLRRGSYDLLDFVRISENCLEIYAFNSYHSAERREFVWLLE